MGLGLSSNRVRLFPPDVPFDPARVPFFYGWGVVAAATVGIVMSIPGQTMGISVFTDHLLAATGLTRLEFSTTYLVGTLISSALLPRGGSLLDRYGSRLVAMASSLTLGVTLILFMFVDATAQFAQRVVGATWPATAMLTFGFTALRFSGQGMLTMSSRTMLTKWFERRRGIATGYAGVIIAFGFAGAPWLLQGLIDLGSWQSAYLVLAAVVGVGMTFVAWGFYRDTPEECGLQMDGVVSPTDDPSEGPQKARWEATRAEAMRTLAFWSVTVALAINAMVFTGVTFHIVDLGRETGIGGERAVGLFLPIAAVSTVARLASGWAADRYEVKPLVLIFLIAQTAGFIGAGRLAEPAFEALMVAGWGVSAGLFGTIANVNVPNYFGREHLGAIASIQMTAMVAGSAIGPALLALAKDFIGSYREGLLLCCILTVAGLMLSSVATKPGPSQDRISAQ